MFGINQHTSVKQVSFKQNINKFKIIKKKGGGEYPEELYKKVLMTSINIMV